MQCLLSSFLFANKKNFLFYFHSLKAFTFPLSNNWSFLYITGKVIYNCFISHQFLSLISLPLCSVWLCIIRYRVCYTYLLATTETWFSWLSVSSCGLASWVLHFPSRRPFLFLFPEWKRERKPYKLLSLFFSFSALGTLLFADLFSLSAQTLSIYISS